MARPALALLLIFAILVAPPPAAAYSVLTHEEVVDMAWEPYIRPLLQTRYPGLTPDQLREAHSYAYGGSLIQDLGYYPFGNKFFSDLLHYVRTGDFVQKLISDSQNADELAFALGALAHYTSDSIGHPYVNRATAEENPKLLKKFGPSVTYEQSPIGHIRTEFGFDVVEVAHGRYSQDNYRDFIGFEVAKPLLDRAFRETYGFNLSEILSNEDRAINTYRSTVSSLIPKMTKVAVHAYSGQIEKESPGFDHRKFVYRLRRTDFERRWGRNYKKPSFEVRFLAFVIRILPKIGPLRILNPIIPQTAQQDEYIRSVNQTVDQLDLYLVEVGAPATTPQLKSVSAQPLSLSPTNLDTGTPIHFGQYKLADQTHAKLLDQCLKSTSSAPDEIVQTLTTFYAKPPEGNDKIKPEDFAKIQSNLQLLRQRASDAPALPPSLPGKS